MDYVLPDYCPEIFKIVKCIVVPELTSYNISGSRLTYDISVCVKVLYCSEEGNVLRVIEQKLVYSKTAETNRTGINPNAEIKLKTDYVNCRAVNSRRIDIRGAVSAEILVTDICKNEVISDAFGMDIKIKKVPIVYPINRLFTSKQISVNEELELGMSKPSVDSIVFFDAAVSSTDKKIIANKMVAKGEICINLIYTYASENDNGIESMQFTVPFSQIIDFEGIDERFDCFVDAEILACEAVPHADSDGNSKIIDCNISLMIKCSAFRTSAIELAVDEYSTSYESSDTKENFKIESAPQYINASGIIKASADFNESISRVYCVKCNIKDYSASAGDNLVDISGNASYTIIGCGEDGKPVSIDKDESFTLNIPTDNISENCTVYVKMTPLSCSYNLTSDTSVDIKTDIKVCGTAVCTSSVEGLCDIFIDENQKAEHNDNCAVKLYFASAGEEIWDIAKKYRSSETAIFEENEIDSETVPDNCMLIIPML